MSGIPAQKKKQTNINELWVGGFSQNVPKPQVTSHKNNNNSFDYFNGFGDKPTQHVQSKPTQNNTVNF